MAFNMKKKGSFPSTGSSSQVDGSGATEAGDTDKTFEELTAWIKRSVVASIAGGVIAAAGRPFSPEGAAKVFNDVLFEMFPHPDDPAYKDWVSRGQSKVEIK